MPIGPYGCAFDPGLIERRHAYEAKLEAKGLVRDTGKFTKVLHRNRHKWLYAR